MIRTRGQLRRFLHQEAKRLVPVWQQPEGYDTGVMIYNPIVRKKVPLILKNHKTATWYSCGPTVYDSAHIGHACSYIRFDIIRRILTNFFDITVVPVMGITDIDDKIIMRSQGSSQFSDWNSLAKHFEQQFLAESKKLNILPPFLYCRVSDYIPTIISFISTLIEKDYAYKAEDNSVYFDATKYADYGKLWKPDEPTSHAFKRSSWDFALWKASKPGEPRWESPWGDGRPGWHIECSAMASRIFGEQIDIHTGGVDLTFPHHENEEAQSCCHHGTRQWVNYWIHSGLLHLEDIKMSKSLQNTISIAELLEKYTANQFRLLCLLTHYRSPIEFSATAMQKSVSILKKFEYFQSDCENYVTGNLPAGNIESPVIQSKLEETRRNIKEALKNDFATSTVIDELTELVALVNKGLKPIDEKNRLTEVREASCVGAVGVFVEKVLTDLGIERNVAGMGDTAKFNEVVDNFVRFRAAVRTRALAGKDKEVLGECDEVRTKLAGCGIKIRDVKDKSTWTLVE